MKIAVLDKASLGKDTPFDKFNELGDVSIYESTTPDQIAQRCADVDCIVVNKVKITDNVLESLPKLKLICVFATGYDNIDIAAAKRHGVAVCNVPGYSTDSVALFTVATALSLYTHINEYNEFVKSGEYARLGLSNRLIPVYHELWGKIWGIIGCGSIGSAVARVAEAMGASVLVNKRTPAKNLNCVDLETLCRESDIISVHCPLTEETRGLINKNTLSIMKKGVILVNEARGAVLDEVAVADAVLNGQIGGFGCDVYTSEPFGSDHPYHKILDCKNVILTPHAAWGAYEARVRCINIICNNITSFNDGKILNRVDI